MKKHQHNDAHEQEAAKAVPEETYKEMENRYLRALADYKNLEHRTHSQIERIQHQTKQDLIARFLTILDTVDQAEQYENSQGTQMIAQALRNTLAELGVSEIVLQGNEFNPEYAEVVEITQGTDDNIVTQVVQKAYQLNGTVIRHGKVVVSKKITNN
ncbi:nucleotide exchange factor GrpE [Candidatus Woesebacteria bacterium]|nr:nucleotide exchange factor GrpE [Candidatus Woesebacteria bacterium]